MLVYTINCLIFVILQRYYSKSMPM